MQAQRVRVAVYLLDLSGSVFISVKDADKEKAVDLARELFEMGFKIIATKGTCIKLIENNIPSEFILKMTQGRPNVADAIINGEINLVINTTIGKQSIKDSFYIRRTSLDKHLPYVTTIRAASAVVKAIAAMKERKIKVKPLQAYYQKRGTA